MKYRVIETEWRGGWSGNFYKCYHPQKKTFLFGWISMVRQGFDTTEEAEDYIKNSITYPNVVKEFEL